MSPEPTWVHDDIGLTTGQGALWSYIDKSINKPMPWLVLIAIVSCSLSGVALGLSIAAKDAARIAERETRLQRLEVDELKVALQVQGIKIHEGSTP